MEIKKQVEKSVTIYKRLLHHGKAAGKAMYYNEEERDMLIAKLLFYLIVFVGIVTALIVLAVIIF